MNEPTSALARKLLEQRDALFGYILALVRNWNAAEELFQEVSLVVLQKGQEGVEIAQFGPWSREIARRLVLNYWKTSSRTRLVLSTAALDSLDRAFEEHDEKVEDRRQERLQQLRRCLESLPDHLRRVVDLRYEGSLPLQEIARKLGRSAGSIQVALSRIRMQLHQCTQRLQDGPGASPV